MQNSISKLMSAKTLTFSAALLAVAAPAFAVGCSSTTPSSTGSGTVGATAVAYDRSTHALTAGSLTIVEGTYGALCTGHLSGDPWSVNFNGTAAVPVLQVKSTDSAACQLTLTTLVTAAATYTTTSPIILGAAFSGIASLFTGTAVDSFYANAQITPVNFSTDVVINVVTSDDAVPTGTTPITATQVAVASATQSGIAAPDYSETTNSIVLTDDSDGGVSSSSGTVSYTNVGNPGEAYLIAPNGFMPSFATDDAEFTADAGGIPTAITTNPFSIDATAFSLNGSRVPETRTVIIQHTDGTTMDKTYETFQYTFN